MNNDSSKLFFMDFVLRIAYSFLIVTLLSSFIGCTTVPVYKSLDDNNYNINVKENKQMLPYNVALVIDTNFTNFTLKSVLNNMNMTYDFDFKLGKDMSMTIPKILGRRFERITVLPDKSGIENYDIVIVPSVKLSRISTRISTDITQEPIYAIEVNLGIIANNKNLELLNKNIKEGGEFKTEIACWTCWGKEVLNQRRISDEYQSIVDKVNVKLYNLVDEIVDNKNNGAK